MNRAAETERHRMRNLTETDFVAVDHFAGICLNVIEIEANLQAQSFRRGFEHSRREFARQNFCRTLIVDIRQGQHFIVVGVRDDIGADAFLVVFQIIEIRNDEIHARNTFIRILHAAIEYENILVDFDHEQIFTALIETAKSKTFYFTSHTIITSSLQAFLFYPFFGFFSTKKSKKAHFVSFRLRIAKQTEFS